jgi:hypothetical protein
MSEIKFVNCRAFQRVGFILVMCLTCITQAWAYQDNRTKEDYQVQATLTNYLSGGVRSWRVMLRVKSITLNRFMYVFPAAAVDCIPIFAALDFDNFTFTENSTTNATYIEKLYTLNRYTEAVAFVFNAFQILSDKAKAQFGNQTFVAFTFSDLNGIDFRNTGQTVPNADWYIDTSDQTALKASEQKLADKYYQYLHSQ